MNKYRAVRNQRGITLIAVVMVVLAIGLIAYFAGAIAVKLQEIGKERNTVNRMLVIRDALKKYYRAHRDLPVDAADRNKIPVQELSLEQKYRVDAWGQYFYFEWLESTSVPSRTDINGVQIETNPPVAALILSLGSDQAQNYTRSVGTTITFTTTTGDVVVPVNVQAEAIEVANNELRELAKKACAYKCADYIWPPPPEIVNIINRFSLGDSFGADPWLDPYLWEDAPSPSTFPRVYSAGPDGVTPSSDDIFVTVGGIDCCPSGPTPPIPGLVGLWNFSAAPGSGPGGVQDSSGASNDGTVYSNPPSNSGATWIVGGTIGAPFPGALYFDGNDYITIPSSDSLNLESDFTLAAWIMKPTNSFSPAYQKVISRRTAYRFYFLGVDQRNPYGGAGNASGWNVTPRLACDGLYTPQTGYVPPTGCAYNDTNDPNWYYRTHIDSWYHLAFVYDNNDSSGPGPGPSAPPHSMKVYITKLGDTDVSLKQYGWTVRNPGGLGGINITIGADSNGTEHFFKGYIVYVAVYNRALSQAEIQTLYEWR